MLIFNRNFKFKNDVERILIINDPEFTQDSYISFVHPVLAWIINMFDGTKEDNLLIEEISQALDAPSEYIQNLIFHLATSEKEVVLRYDNVISVIPPKVLEENTGDKFREKESLEFFNIGEKLNHTDWRLFKPITLLICPTLRCFTDCVYCYANRHHPYKELSISRWVNLIRFARESGIERVDVTGGEFFLFKGWQQIAKELTSNGFFPDISTKTPLTKETLDDIINSGLRTIQFSLDTLDSVVSYRTLAVNKNYISRLKETIEYADKIGLKLIIKPTLSRTTCNIENIESILRFVSRMRNVERVVISIIGFSCYKQPLLYPQIRPTLEQVRTLRKWLSQNVNNYLYPVIDDTFIYTSGEMRNISTFSNRARCTANIEGFVVLPDGTATICEELYWLKPFIIGNINSQSISEIWNSPQALGLYNLTREDLPSTSKCSQCAKMEQCHKKKGVCWKLVISAYGESEAFQADPRCPSAPNPANPLTLD